MILRNCGKTVSRRRATVSTLVGGAANTLIVSIQAVVLIPLFLHAIGPRLYGAWLGSGDMLVWLQAFDLGLPNLMIQRIGAAHGKSDLKSVAEYFAAGIFTLAVVALVVMAVALALSFRLPGWMGLTGTEAKTLRLCFTVGSIAAALNIVNNSVVGFSRGIQNTAFMNLVVIASGLAGFGVSLILILTGWGLWAIALGLATRTAIALAGSAMFTARTVRGDLRRFFRIRTGVLREFLATSPATALGGLGYTLMNQSESAFVAIFIKPELATVFNLTRKVVDVARGLVDMIGYASYGSFAHLVTSDQRKRTLEVHAEVNSLRTSLAVIMAATYMAINASLVTVWVGAAQYGGSLLTILMALQFLVVGGSYLMNYLYRATGPVVRGSLALLIECVLRVPLMIMFLLWIGLPGIPIAGIITGTFFGVLVYGWTLKNIACADVTYPRTVRRVWIARSVLFCIGIFICLFVRVESWVFVLAVASGMILVGAIVLISIDPLLRTLRVPLTSILERLRHAV